MVIIKEIFIKLDDFKICAKDCRGERKRKQTQGEELRLFGGFKP